MTSSNTFCLLSNMPARCHASPYSPPPRAFTVAQTPPRSSHASTSGPHAGSNAMPNPPKPASNVGCVPSLFRSFACVMNIGTRVPSFEFKNTRSVVYNAGSNVSAGGSNGVLRPVATSKRKTVAGYNGDVNV
jgi:hypothetical protein